MAERTVLVTGATGAVGRALVDALTADGGWAVRALVHRRAPDPRGPEVEVVRGDLRAGDFSDAVAGVDAIVHAAGVTHTRRPRLYERVNVEGTERLAAAAGREGVDRFVHISSRAAAPAGGGAYSLSKHRAEASVQAQLDRATVLRLPELYDREGREGLARIVRQALRGAPIPVVGDGGQEISPAHLDDVIRAIAVALESDRAAGRLYTLAGEPTTVRGFATRCISAFSSTSRIVGVPRPIVAALAQASRIVPLPVYPDQLARLEVDKPRGSPEAADDLGFRPRTLDDGLRAISRAP